MTLNPGAPMTHDHDHTTTARGRAHRGARPHQAVRQLHRRRRPVLHRRARPDHRLPRARTAPARPPRCGCCSAWSGRPSGTATIGGRAYHDIPQPLRDGRLGARGHQLPPRPHRPRPPARAGRHRGRRRAAGSTRCSSSSASPPRPASGPAATRWACASGSASRPPCSATPRCSSSTSRPTASTPRASAGCAASCATCPPRARRSSSPATCSRRSSRPSTTSSSSATAGSSSRAPMADLHGEAARVVRTTDRDALAGALRVADVTSAGPGRRAARRHRRPAPHRRRRPAGRAPRLRAAPAPRTDLEALSSSSSPRAPTATSARGAAPTGRRRPSHRKGRATDGRRDHARSSASSSRPACGGAWPSAWPSLAAAISAGFAALVGTDFGDNPNSGAGNPFAAMNVGTAQLIYTAGLVQNFTTLFPLALGVLLITQRVPPQDDHRDLPRAPRGAGWSWSPSRSPSRSSAPSTRSSTRWPASAAARWC